MNEIRIGSGSREVLFLPGFMSSPQAYRELLEPVADAGWTVRIPQLYKRGLGTLLGNVGVRQEAMAAAALLEPSSLVAGHSRGGQAAWLAAGLTPVAGVVLVDPVDGEGRKPSGPTSTAAPAAFDAPCLIVGAGVRGACAPAQVNYECFVRATPGARSVVVPGLGHADILGGRARSFGRRLCGGGADPDAARREVSRLIVQFVAALD